MAHLIEVAFKGNRKEFYLWDGDDPPRLNAPIIVEGDRGEDMGHVHAHGESAASRFVGVAHGAAQFGGNTAAQPDKRALRLATDEELQRAGDLAEQNESARRRAIERVKAHGLVMKVSDAEWQWDRRKLTLYFTAEKRVDFRSLVRDLAALFRTRIELKQIGVRDEAKRLNGVGRCGREYCSASWLPELRPVNLSVAKDQHLSLNPTQISGACGRLMCSLRYEHEFYVQSRKRFPKEGKVLVTARGEEKVLANDIFRDRVTLRGLDGEIRVVPLADLRQELASLSADREASGVSALASDIDSDDELRGDVERGVDRDTSDRDTDDADRRRGDRRRPPLPWRLSDDATPAQAREPLVVVEPAPVESAPAVAPLPAEPIASVPNDAIDVAPADVIDTDVDADDDGESDGDGATDGAGATPGAPRPRRRRGRRGGRRGRGGTGTTDEMPTPPTEPSA